MWVDYSEQYTVNAGKCQIEDLHLKQKPSLTAVTKEDKETQQEKAHHNPRNSLQSS